MTRKMFTREDDATLLRMRQGGATFGQIMMALRGHSYGSCKKRYRRLTGIFAAPVDGGQAPFDLSRANLLHLLDLKRAGHSPRVTELRVISDGCPVVARRILAPPRFSGCGSPSALCAE